LNLNHHRAPHEVVCTVQDGRTPLHHAAINGYIKVACLLVERGADTDTVAMVS
jgi:ankyrin repeat protein